MKRPLGFQIELKLPLPSPDDKRADVERLGESAGMEDLHVPLELMSELPSVLRENNFSIKPVFGVTSHCIRLLEINSEQLFGIAIDIGTTNIVASLFDLKAIKRVARLRMTNPQVMYGPDILSRIHIAMSRGVAELQRTLIGGLNSIIKSVTEDSGIKADRVFAVSVASNTSMTHFLLGLDVRNIPVEPYIPVVNSPGFLRACELGLTVNPEAVVYIFPNSGSYVGGDIISGILSTGIHTSESPSVLIDVGTNVEIVVGMKDWLLVGAGAAGPALEGGIFSAGKRAQDGAIYRVEIDPASHEVRYKTIGDAPPIGICASGVIDLIAELFEKGIIDSAGRFRETGGVTPSEEGPLFTVARTGRGAISVSEREVSNFLRSKAAMFTSLHLLLKSLGLRFKDIDKVFLAGAIGSGVRVQKAISIGMLPDIPVEKYLPVGNSSLKGAELLLTNSELCREVKMIHSMITYKEMNTDPEFMKAFPGALFLPHATPEILTNG